MKELWTLHREEAFPIGHLVVDERPKVCFKRLVQAFGLTVGLGVEGR